MLCPKNSLITSHPEFCSPPRVLCPINPTIAPSLCARILPTENVLCSPRIIGQSEFKLEFKVQRGELCVHHPLHLHHCPHQLASRTSMMMMTPTPPTTQLRSPCRWSTSPHEHRYSHQSQSRSHSRSHSCDCRASDPFARSNECPP